MYNGNAKFRAIYLASKSPRRRDLLTQVKIPFTVLPFRGPPREDSELEEKPLTQENAADYAARLARGKVLQGLEIIALRKSDIRPVLGADTIIEYDGKIIGKPESVEHARQILHLLSGKTHRVITAVSIALEARMESIVSINEVQFCSLSERDISDYVATGEPFDKAGAYGIQGQAARFIARISGSYSGIMGLPLFETCALLNQFPKE